MSGKQEQAMLWMHAISEDPEIPAWKSLDNVIRKWAVLSQHENDLAQYQKIQELYTLR